MSVHRQKSTWLIFLIMCLPLLATGLEEIEMEQMEQTTPLMVSNDTAVTEPPPSTNSTKDLDASETADPKKVDIVKQIRRLNDDGSYTVGYEAGDGTFKIESRDVQGNIKGTFGYVDQDGEIKRVSYSTSNATQPSPIPPIVQLSSRFNRTGSTTTRRPQPTLIYPKTSSNPTRATVIQAIPRRRPVSSSSHAPVTTTESYRVVTGNYLNTNTSDSNGDSGLPKTIKQFPIFTPRAAADASKPVFVDSETSSVEPKVYRPIGHSRLTAELNNTVLTTTPSYLRSTIIFEKTSERTKEAAKSSRPNTFRRQLSPTNYENEQMFAFQQAAGDDTTDVYGGSISVGTPRPLFTTTTQRPRLVPIHSILAARQKLSEKLATNSPQVHEDQQESTLEATTNKIDSENYVTTNPIPIIQYPIASDQIDQRVIERPFLNRPDGIPIAQFRTREFLRDNPGAPIPIGNQRVLFRYNPNIQIDENGQYVRQPGPPPIPQGRIIQVPPNRAPHNVQNINIPQNHNQDPKQNLIALHPVHPVHPGQIPNPRYQIFNPYNQERENNVIPQRVPPALNDFRPIVAPVSTRDLKLLLHQLLIRQNRLQALMDIREDFTPAGPPYQNQQYQPQNAPLFEPEFRQKPVYGGRSAYPPQFQEGQVRPYNGYPQPVPFNQNNYQYQQPQYQNQNQFVRNQYRQEDGYRNDINNFDPAVPYESQRFIPRRRFYRPRPFDPRFEETAPSENEEQVEYLPPDVREALLLKMLMLAIHPDFSPMPADAHAAMTTPAPEFRKKVRNVQILGEEADTKESELRRKERMMKIQGEM